jgi:hypothetical protein
VNYNGDTNFSTGQGKCQSHRGDNFVAIKALHLAFIAPSAAPPMALREFTRALTIDPNLPEAHFGQGMLAMQRGATDEARRQFQIVANNQVAARFERRSTKQLRPLDKK